MHGDPHLPIKVVGQAHINDPSLGIDHGKNAGRLPA